MGASGNRLRNGTPKRWRVHEALGTAVILSAFALSAQFVSAQQVRHGILAPGNAAVTGFSGAVPPARIAPGIDPAGKTFIDLDGPSLRILDLEHMGGPPLAQFVPVPKLFTTKAAQIGQVFGVALDADTPPNIYAAASSAYGLPIVAPGPDGLPLHVRKGGRGAAFMPGLWGEAAQGGGPGSIWKIDGVTGAASLFANVAVEGRLNSGPALGGLAFDPLSKSLFVTDRETGFIHRFGMNGAELGRYDHGISGRRAQGLPPIDREGAARTDVSSPLFDSTDPATWSYAPAERQVFGLGIFGQRLYYAVAAGLEIWSVGLAPDGSFRDDATIEIAVPPAAGPTEISKIIFDAQGRMYLGERPSPSGVFDLEALIPSGIGRVLRYAIVGAGQNERPIWQPLPDEYAIGFPGELRNGNGGVEIGYPYDRRGDIERGTCGEYLWSTGERLRESSDPALAARLSRSGPFDVAGLQGTEIWRVRWHDEPPLESYFLDYDDRFDDAAARGHLGDLAIWRLPCESKAPGSVPSFGGTRLGGGLRGATPPAGSPPPAGPPSPPGGPPPPSGGCPPGRSLGAHGECPPACPAPSRLLAGQCCSPDDIRSGGACSPCGPGQSAVGASHYCCDDNRVYTNASGARACCLSGQVVNGQCQPGGPPTSNCPPGSTDPRCCAPGYVSTGGSCCLAGQMTSTGVCCASGQAPGGPNNSQCRPLILVPGGPRCCANGLVPAGTGGCCAAANLTSTGMCCSGPVDPKDRTHCPAQIQSVTVCAPGYTKMSDGSCCNNHSLGPDGRSCRPALRPLPLPTPVPPPPVCSTRGREFVSDPKDPRLCIRCGRGLVANADHTACVRPSPLPAPPPMDCSVRGRNFVRDPENPRACIRCGTGSSANADHTICIPSRINPPHMPPPAGCRGNFVRNPREPGACLPCARGLVPNRDHSACIPSRLAPFFPPPETAPRELEPGYPPRGTPPGGFGPGFPPPRGGGGSPPFGGGVPRGLGR